MLSLIVLIFFLLVYYLIIYSRDDTTLTCINVIPGPKPLPMIGNFLEMNLPIEKIHKKLQDIAREYYPIFKLQIFTRPLIFVQHPEDIKTILISKANVNKSSDYNHLKSVNNNDGINVSTDDKWHGRRKLLSSAFSLSVLKTDAKIIKDHGKNFVEYLKTCGDVCIHDLIPLISKLNLDIVCETTMGIKLDQCQIGGEANFREGADFYAEMPLYRAARPYIKDWMIHFLPIGWKRSRLMKKYNAFLCDIIEKRRVFFAQTGNADKGRNVDDDEAKSSDAFKVHAVDILLHAEKEGLIDSKGVVEEAESLIFAGFKTAALTMSYGLLLLAENENIQQKAREEVDKVFGNSGDDFDLNKLKKLDHLERCIKETLRLFPAIPRIGRRLGQETNLSNYVLPANSEVAILIDAVHKNPNFWPEPDKYDPDRFLPANERTRHPYSYIPFSAGSRQCLGYKYAMLTIKIILAMVLYEYRLEPATSLSDLEFVFGMDLKPNKPICVKLIKINR